MKRVTIKKQSEVEVEIAIKSLGERTPKYIKLISWMVKTGDQVKKDQKIAILETDKATIELVSEYDGIIHLAREEGDILSIGEVCGTLETTKTKIISDDETSDNIVIDDASSNISIFDPSIHGKSEIEFPFDHDQYPGLIFSGEFKCGKLHGYGSITMSEEFAESTVISGNYEKEGDFIDNELNGLGKTLDYEDQIEFGNFKNGNLDGIGWINDGDYNFTKAIFKNGNLIEIIKECDILNQESRYSTLSIFHSIDLDALRSKLK